jgi:hypothetical protein
MSAAASTPGLSVGEECRKGDLDTVVGGRHQKPGPEGEQNPVRGGGGHVGGALATEDPPHYIESAWLL